MAGADVERERSESLNGVDDEVRAAGAAGTADGLEIDRVSARERDPGNGDGAHGGILEGATQRVFVDRAVAGGEPPVDDAFLPGQLHPRIDVGWEFSIRREHDVARA